MGHGFSKRGSVDLCFSSETLSVVYRDNGDLSEMRGVFYFYQGFKCNLNDENSPMLIKISCKVHIYSTQPEDQFHRVGLPSPALHPL